MPSSRFHGVFGSLLKGKIGIAADQEAGGTSEREGGSAPVGQIAVDVYEEAGYIVIKAPLAGVRLGDLDIDIADNVVTVRGKREQCDAVADEQYYLQECYWGEFSRSVTLPFSVNPSRVKATFSKDNILKVFIPKEERRVKIVKINEGG